MDDICIVGIGCVFPDAPNPYEFWKNIINGKCSIKELDETRWHYSKYMLEEGKIYSNYAAFIDEYIIKKIKEKFRFKDTEINRLQAITLEACSQALKDIPEKFYKKCFISLGCMWPDEMAARYQLIKEKKKLLAFFDQSGINGGIIEEAFDKYEKTIKSSPIELFFTTSVTSLIQKVFSIKGEYCLVDAACASSLAAIDVAINSLIGGEADIAISGGIESQLGPESFAIFCSMNLHSKKIGFPLDDKTDGMNQGEGAAIFILMRLKDALKNKLPILCVIKGIGGSSNGKLSSLFSPTKTAQLIALNKAYVDSKKISYIECHATGTRLGDSTEIDALDDFFKNEPQIPTGSVKALIGHTKGASGAAGLLKSILIIRHRLIPPSPYFESFVDGKKPKSIFVNKKVIRCDNSKIRVGINSAGFGGINYHLLIEEYKEEKFIYSYVRSDNIAFLFSAYLPRKNPKMFFPEYEFKIPPNNLPYIDDLQVMALELVSEAYEYLDLDLNKVDFERINVISASCLGIDTSIELAKRLRHIELIDLLGDSFSEKILSHMRNYIDLHEEIGPGSLNNVIAGRVMNQFDFRGKSYNIDSDSNSFFLALKAAKWELLLNKCDLVFLLFSDEKINENPPNIERMGLNFFVLTRESFSKKIRKEPIGYLNDLKCYHYDKQI